MIKRIFTFVIVATLLVSTLTVSAANSQSYTYSSKNEPTRVPSPYETNLVLTSELSLSEPQDMAVSGGKIYVLDSGNHRILVLSSENYNVERSITFTKDGAAYETQELTGLCIDKETILVVDHSGEKIFRTDMNGVVIQEYTSPYAEGSDEIFMPKKVTVDRTGCLYVLLDTEYRGLMILDPTGDFRNYFGSVNITVTANVLANMFWRNFMTEEQIETSSQYVPGGYSNVTTDGNGFIYTTRGASDSKNELICKLNPSGKNVLGYTGSFGDVNTKTTTSFTALAVDEKSIITALDGANKHLFQYSPDGELLYIFGSASYKDGANNMTQDGTFVTPVDVEYNGEELLILDRDANSITIMSPTKFGTLVQEATMLHRKAFFTEAGEVWKEILKIDSNYEMAYIGLGKVAEASGNYEEAMEYYKISNNRKYYSSAFKKHRAEVIRASFYWAALAIALLVVGYFIYKKFNKGKEKKKVSLEHGGKLAYMFYTVLHPFDGFAELRYNKKYSVKYATIVAALYFFVSCLNYNYNGYIFNTDSAEDFNMWIVFFSTVAVVLLFCLSTWLLTTFLEGKGKFSEIWVVTCYSLVPLVAVSAISLVLSNVMSADESFFYYALQTLGTGWTLILIFISNGKLNQYGFKKNIASIICALIGMLIIVFLMFLFFNLWTQFINFLTSLYDEITYRNLAAS